mgnify:CR=1 FL=1
MKKLLLTTMLVTALAGCSSAKTSTTSATGDHLARIQSAGKITIATEGVWSPFTYHDETTDELVKIIEKSITGDKYEDGKVVGEI